MRKLLIISAAIGILCKAYFDRWRRPVTGLRLLTPAEFWPLHKQALLKAIELKPEPKPEQRVYLSHEGISVHLRRDSAYLDIPSSEAPAQIWLSFPEAGDFAEGAMLACRNRDLFEITVRDISLKVDARIRPAPETIFQKASQMMLGLKPERLVFDVRYYQGRHYFALDRDFFEAGLRELSSLLAVDEQEAMAR